MAATSDAKFVAFKPLSEKMNYVAEEEATLAYWQEIDAFQESMRRSAAAGLPEYSFYDGPPFATGLPHYGHLLAGTIKDTVTRFAYQTGHHVVRRFGWDCHGLPIEYEIDKILKIRGRDDVLKMGIDKYNAECRSIVMRYSKEWEVIVTRMGRWIDFKNDYKTLDPDFMESVWWVFAEIYKKGLVYEGFRVMPFSNACSTPLSNFEAGQNYKNVQDPAVIVSFPLESDGGVALLAWTTTPWTLPSNLALCVHPEFDYVKIQDHETNEVYILVESRLADLYPAGKKDKGPKYTVVDRFKGATLKGLRYVPLFPYFADRANAFVVVTDTYVTADSGTGIVHQAPAFGEDDFRVCMAAGIVDKSDVPCPIDTQGCFTPAVWDFVGRHVKEADADIMAYIKAAKRLVSKGVLMHQYPFCWRSETPLVYRAVPSWFIDVPKIRDQLLANNNKTYWVPDHVKTGRFHRWLEDAREWCVSRNRFWGTPLPIWRSEVPGDDTITVISSIAQLEELSGQKVTDIHRDKIDHLTWKNEKGNTMRRVDEVFDCWFESGSMPYAQKHYPFENRESFERDYFPADFIAEGLDQTRGWFYTLMVISTALFDSPPFKNLIVNGLVLAADGKKMSKSKKNYPDPMAEVVSVYGADALRLCLITSPVVSAEPLKFTSAAVAEIQQAVFNPLVNCFRFFVGYAQRLQEEDGIAFVPRYGSSTNLMDIYIVSLGQSLIKYVRAEMAAYRLNKVVPKILDFIDQLSNWYLRLNRTRMKGRVSTEDTRTSLSVVFGVLLDLSVILAPFTPFLAEYLYSNLKVALPTCEPSVHFLMFPEADEAKVNVRVEVAVMRMQKVIELARVLRDKNVRPTKFPCRRMIVVHVDPEYLEDIRNMEAYIKEEVNTYEVITPANPEAYVTRSFKANGKALGPKLGKELKTVSAAIEKLSAEEIRAFVANGRIEVLGRVIEMEDVTMSLTAVASSDSQLVALADGAVVVLLDLTSDPALERTAHAREILNHVQKLRKTAGCVVQDEINMMYSGEGETLEKAVGENMGIFINALRKPIYPLAMSSHLGNTSAVFATETFEIEDSAAGPFTVTLTFWKAHAVFASSVSEAARLAVAAMDYGALKAAHVPGGSLSAGGATLVWGKDVFLTLEELTAAAADTLKSLTGTA